VYNGRMTYDLIILGGGPAGIAAGVYAARKRIKTLLISDTFGGQSIVSADVQNFIGIKSISGFDLAQKLEEHLRAQESIEIVSGDLAESVSEEDSVIKVKTKNGKEFEGKTLLLAVGSKRRKLGIPGEKEFDGTGVAYCGTCDAPLFAGKEVAVVGGGNAGLETVRDLLPYASGIVIFEYADEMKGDPVTLEKIMKSGKVEALTGVQVLEIFGDKNVEGLKYRERSSREEKQMDLEGVFVEIGWIPNSGIAKGLVDLNNYGEVIVDHKTQKTSHDRVWAAGDVADVLYKQNNISMGDAVKAVLNIYDYLDREK